MAAKQFPLHFEFRANQTFISFFPGANAEIINHLHHGLAGNGEPFIFLWGNAGLGKTHLLQACCHEAQRNKLNSFYFDLAQAERVDPQILKGLDECDLVCFDNIEQIAGKPDWELAVFNFFNTHRDLGHKLIVSAACAPGALAVQLADLKTRLNWGLILKLKALDEKDKLAALIFKAQQMGLEISPQAGRFLLTHVDRDPASLWNLLEKLDHASLSAHRKLTIPFLKLILNKHPI